MEKTLKVLEEKGFIKTIERSCKISKNVFGKILEEEVTPEMLKNAIRKTLIHAIAEDNKLFDIFFEEATETLASEILNKINEKGEK